MHRRTDQRTRGDGGGRSRSFGGCVTCRSRHMKCDEARPNCVECSNAGLRCGGYGKKIFFDFERARDSQAVRFRRPLLTDTERECMSEQLTSCVPPRLAHWHISQIDEKCEGLPPSKDIQICHGPFGAFRVAQSQAVFSDQPSSECPGDVSSPPDIRQSNDSLSLSSTSSAVEVTAPLLDANFQQIKRGGPYVEQQSEQAPMSEDMQVCCAPFQWSRSSPTPLDTLQDPTLGWLGEHSSQQHDMQPNDEFFLSANAVLTPRTEQLLHIGFDLPQQGINTHILDMWNSATNTGQVQEIFDDMEITLPEPPHTSILSPTITDTTAPSLEPDFTRSARHHVNTLPQSIDNAVPHDAVFLIKHYSTTVLRFLTPFRHSKTPWHVLFIPHVKSCLAALTLDEQMEHARLCAFFGTLAISAFSLGGIHESQMWLAQATTYKEMGSAHAQSMLETAYDVPKKAKYKSILMAILTMAQLHVVTGNRDGADYYLLEAEKFIRVKGLNRKKSRKVRLLHHCYAFERMFHESTFIVGLNSSHRRHVRKAIESSGAAAHSQDSLSFRLGNWDNLDQEMTRIKEQEQGENDLHIQLPGLWSATLYPEIFGVPEVYIFVLSLIIRLGREKDDAQQNNSQNLLSVKDFTRRAKAVERVINQLRRPSPTSAPETPLPTEPEHQATSLLSNMLDAIQHALSIYFYRRIYDLDPSLLQTKVSAVLECLTRFESADSDMLYCSMRLVWPAFIAACEAEEFEIQAAFSNWFHSLARRSGLAFFKDTCANVERVWEEKRKAGGVGVTWLEVLKAGVIVAN